METTKQRWKSSRIFMFFAKKTLSCHFFVMWNKNLFMCIPKFGPTQIDCLSVSDVSYFSLFNYDWDSTNIREKNAYKKKGSGRVGGGERGNVFAVVNYDAQRLRLKHTF
eukprot:GEMP01083833.1.p1 GENE.GEMP01083833.1~~GEMP01083833.1.p1  ORF type:complete len:109 (-),score=3.25 GEMP01083833.1:690-1016(-)